jgi:hypothetical protein
MSERGKVSVATETRERIDDANTLLKETYPLVKNPNSSFQQSPIAKWRCQTF